MSKSKQEYYKIKSTLPPIIVNMGKEIETIVKSGKSQGWYAGLQSAMESELKSQVMSTNMDAHQAHIVSNYFGLHGNWEQIEPLRVAIRREKRKLTKR